jgi:hypothetical protein
VNLDCPTKREKCSCCASVYPVSCVLANKDIMLCIKPGEHGSTYGGCVRFFFNRFGLERVASAGLLLFLRQ